MRFFSALVITLGAALFLGPSAGADWFSHGLGPVDPGVDHPSLMRASECRSCHESIYRDWAASRHSHAWDNLVFQDGFLREPSTRCIWCHAPLTSQLRELQSVKFFGELPAASEVHEGVSCATCHVREGQIFSARKAGDSAHSFSFDPVLKSPKFCAGCHQFNFDETKNGARFITEVPIQNTYAEWTEYQRRGGGKTCVQCHMPGGRHLFWGSHHEDLLRSALKFSFSKNGRHRQLQISTRDVGHDFPTGDLFRHLEFLVKAPGHSRWKTLFRFGRSYGLGARDDGSSFQTLRTDTALRPFETRRLEFSAPQGALYRFTYFYVPKKSESSDRIPAREKSLVIAEGPLD